MDRWTGVEAQALRQALRLSVRAFAERELGVSVRTVSNWESRGAGITPITEMQRALDTALARADDDVKARFSRLVGGSTQPHTQLLAPSVVRPAELPVLDDLRRSLFGHFVHPCGELDQESTAARIKSDVVQAHRLYQMADYDGSAALLPGVISRMEASTDAIPLKTKATAYLAAAKLASKVGDPGLAWVTADRCLRLAEEAELPALLGIAKCQVAQALFGDGHLTDAEQTASSAVEHIASVSAESDDKDALSARGALLLLSAVMAAGRGDARAATANLDQAAALTDRLKMDDNRLWTAFGATNTAIHELAVHVALGDSQKALQLGENLDTDTLPAALRGRRSQVHVELGWASAGQGDDGLAVLHLLEAERVAQQAVSRNATARALLATLVARERKSATPGLRALATRAGVLP